MAYSPNPSRYENMPYNRVGKSGLKLPAISLGLWHNFGDEKSRSVSREMCLKAFDLGITHFDLANNYGVPAGSAESNFGELLRSDLGKYRHEIVISSKAGYFMWDGPYGEWGSRKYLLTSLDQSLKRMGLDYVDIFYSHRFDPDTPLEETMGALDYAVRSGKALYAGISSYPPEETRKAAAILKELGTPCLIHQPEYSIFNRTVEDTKLLDAIDDNGMGCIVFCPLAQGRLTDKYLNGIPEDSRIADPNGFIGENDLNDELVRQIKALNDMAQSRGQSLAQMALAWTLKDNRVTSAIIGASRVSQIEDCVGALKNTSFSDEEVTLIDTICGR